MVESEAHIHEGLGGGEVFRLLTLKQADSEILHESEEDVLVHSLVVHPLWTMTTDLTYFYTCISVSLSELFIFTLETRLS